MAKSNEATINSKKILLEKIIEKALDTEKNNKKVVASAAKPNDFFLLCIKYFDIINVKINKSTGNNKRNVSTLIMVITYFIHFF